MSTDIMNSRRHFRIPVVLKKKFIWLKMALQIFS